MFIRYSRVWIWTPLTFIAELQTLWKHFVLKNIGQLFFISVHLQAVAKMQYLQFDQKFMAEIDKRTVRNKVVQVGKNVKNW